MSLIPRSEFVGLEGVAHLCTGGEAPWLRSHDEAAQRFGRLKSAGMAGREEIFAVCARAKAGIARLLGIPPERVAFLSSATEGIHQALEAVDWRPGDNVVAGRVEYPSLLLPLSRLRARGVEVRLVDMPGRRLALDAMAAAVDARTRLVAVSHVSWVTGQRVDLVRCAAMARSRGALLLVDATHSLGAAPVPGALCDFVVSSCYKWLLGTHGAAVFACDPARAGDVQPRTVGWHSVTSRDAADPLSFTLRPDASRLEAGNPGLLPLFVLDSALRHLLPLDPRAVLEHAHALGDLLVQGLRARGRALLTPEQREERAGNICFPDADAPGLAARLAGRGVLVWGSEGRVRVSVHVHNDPADVGAFFAALDAVS